MFLQLWQASLDFQRQVSVKQLLGLLSSSQSWKWTLLIALVFLIRALYQLHLVKAATVRACIPKEFRLVQAFG